MGLKNETNQQYQEEKEKLVPPTKAEESLKYNSLN
jgi:hypothetical protein